MSQARQIIKQSTVYAVANMSRQLVGFLMLPIYTQYLSPADYGIVGLLVFMVSLIELLFGGHMYHAVPKLYFDTNDKQKRNCIISTALLVTSIISGLSVTLVMFFSEDISFHLLGESNYQWLVVMFGIQILTNALENYGFVYIRLLKRMWTFVGISIGKLILQLSLNIFLVVILQKGVWGIAIGSLIASVTIAIILLIYTVIQVGIRYNKYFAMRLLKFSWPLWISGLAGLYIGSSNRYFIRLFSSLDEVGLYELAARFGSIVTILVWVPFSQYWQTERFNIHKQDNPIPVFQTTFSVISAIMLLAGLGVSLFSLEIVTIMADEAFHAATQAIPYLVLAAIFQSLTVFNNFSFLVTEKTGWMSKNSFLTAAIISIFYFILIPRFGFVGAAQSIMIANASQFFIVFFAAKKQYDMQLQLFPLFLSLIFVVAAYAIGTLIECKSIWHSILYKSGVFIGAFLLVVSALFLSPTIRQAVKNSNLGLILLNRRNI
jgi:O-antigen/teichoic acid export membrane protein